MGENMLLKYFDDDLGLNLLPKNAKMIRNADGSYPGSSKNKRMNFSSDSTAVKTDKTPDLDESTNFLETQSEIGEDGKEIKKTNSNKDSNPENSAKNQLPIATNNFQRAKLTMGYLHITLAWMREWSWGTRVRIMLDKTHRLKPSLFEEVSWLRPDSLKEHLKRVKDEEKSRKSSAKRKRKKNSEKEKNPSSKKSTASSKKSEQELSALPSDTAPLTGRDTKKDAENEISKVIPKLNLQQGGSSSSAERALALKDPSMRITDIIREKTRKSYSNIWLDFIVAHVDWRGLCAWVQGLPLKSSHSVDEFGVSSFDFSHLNENVARFLHPYMQEILDQELCKRGLLSGAEVILPNSCTNESSKTHLVFNFARSLSGAGSTTTKTNESNAIVSQNEHSLRKSQSEAWLKALPKQIIVSSRNATELRIPLERAVSVNLVDAVVDSHLTNNGANPFVPHDDGTNKNANDQVLIRGFFMPQKFALKHEQELTMSALKKKLPQMLQAATNAQKNSGKESAQTQGQMRIVGSTLKPSQYHSFRPLLLRLAKSGCLFQDKNAYRNSSNASKHGSRNKSASRARSRERKKRKSIDAKYDEESDFENDLNKENDLLSDKLPRNLNNLHSSEPSYYEKLTMDQLLVWKEMSPFHTFFVKFCVEYDIPNVLLLYLENYKLLTDFESLKKLFFNRENVGSAASVAGSGNDTTGSANASNIDGCNIYETNLSPKILQPWSFLSLTGRLGNKHLFATSLLHAGLLVNARQAQCHLQLRQLRSAAQEAQDERSNIVYTNEQHVAQKNEIEKTLKSLPKISRDENFVDYVALNDFPIESKEQIFCFLATLMFAPCDSLADIFDETKDSNSQNNIPWYVTKAKVNKAIEAYPMLQVAFDSVLGRQEATIEEIDADENSTSKGLSTTSKKKIFSLTEMVHRQNQDRWDEFRFSDTNLDIDAENIHANTSADKDAQTKHTTINDINVAANSVFTSDGKKIVDYDEPLPVSDGRLLF